MAILWLLVMMGTMILLSGLVLLLDHPKDDAPQTGEQTRPNEAGKGAEEGGTEKEEKFLKNPLDKG